MHGHVILSLVVIMHGHVILSLVERLPVYKNYPAMGGGEDGGVEGEGRVDPTATDLISCIPLLHRSHCNI